MSFFQLTLRSGQVAIVGSGFQVAFQSAAYAQNVYAQGDRAAQRIVDLEARTTIPTVSQGLLGQTVFLATDYEFNYLTCTLVSDGVWTTVTPPKYGAISTQIVEAPIYTPDNFGGCNGTLIAQNYVYETLSAGHPEAAADNFTLEFGETAGSSEGGVFSVTVNRGPRMLLFSLAGQPMDVTSQTTTVAVGQGTGASADWEDYAAAGTSVTSSSYSSDGKKVESYMPSSGDVMCNPTVPCPATAPDSAEPGWAYVDAGRFNETWSYTTSDGASGSVSTTFKAVAPTGVSVNTPVNPIYSVTGSDGSVSIHFGNGTSTSTAGLVFSGAATDPPGFPGTYEWVQVQNKVQYTDVHQVLGGGTASETCVLPNGLDTLFPYDVGLLTSDRPSLLNVPSTYIKVSPSMSFTMYLLWTPNQFGFAAIPLGQIKWSWSATAKQKDGAWSLSTTNPGPIGAFISSDAYPQWNAISVSPGGVFTCAPT